MADLNTLSSAKCGICSDVYTDPRMLQCLHSFCMKCLKKLSEEQGSGSSLICPTCEKTASLSDAGLDTLPKDLHKVRMIVVAEYESKLQGVEETPCDRCIETSNGPAVSFCVNCCEFLCKVCTKDHKAWRKTLSHELQPVGTSAKVDSTTITKSSLLKRVPEEPVYCQIHPDEVLKFYCDTCNVLVCRDCVILEHVGHSYNRIEKVAEKEKVDLLASLGSADGAKNQLDDAIAKGGKVLQQVQAKQKSVEEDIEHAFKALGEALQKRKKLLLAKAAEIGLGKQTALTMQGEEFKALRDEILQTCEMITTAAEVYTLAEMLSVKGIMTDRLKMLVKQFQEINLEPCRSDTMPSALDTSELVEKIASFGVVVGGSYPAEAKTDLHIPRAIVGKERRVTISACDIQGKPFPHGREKVEVAISLMGSNDPPLKGNVVDNNDGTYLAMFTARSCGEHELNITVENQAVKGSPFVLHVREQRNYRNLSSYQRVFQTSSCPYGVTVDDNGDVYVAASNGHCINVFNQQGTMVRSIGTNGNGDGQFTNLFDVAIQGNVLYIVDHGNHRVQKMTISGEFISKFGTYGSGNGQLYNPRGICLDRKGRIFVSEYTNSRVSVFESDGTFAHHITGNLSYPWGLTFDPSGNLHVTNYGSYNVTVFSPDGEYISQYASQVSGPAGIVIDVEGYSLIAEYGGNRFSVLSPDQHQLITHVQCYYATGIAIDKAGSIYVSSYGNNQVLKY